MIAYKGFKIFKYVSLGSTNDEALNILKSGVIPPIVVVSEEQKSGRGRSGHTWISKPGGLYFSLGLSSGGLKEDAKLIVLASLPVVETLMDFGLKPRIKIPNDVYIGDKKISGILGERKSNFLILGIGINVNQSEFPENLAATSMYLETGRVFDKDQILYTFLDKFDQLIKSRSVAYDRWVNFVTVIGKRVRFTYKGQGIETIVKSVDRDLNLVTDAGIFNIYEIFGFEEL